MLDFNLLPLGNVSFGPTVVVGTGYVGPAEQRTHANPSDLQVSWQELEADEPDPFALLSWQTRVSNFRGRDDEMTDLEQWAMAREPVRVKFITGEGGAGKSRLAAEFADRMQIRHDWAAGFVDLRNPRSFNVRGAGNLLIIDYPEEYIENVSEIFRDLARIDQTELTAGDQIFRIRVLFITRQRINDWQRIINDNNAASLVNKIPIVLDSLDLEAAHDLYNSAIIRASEVLGEIVPTLSQEMMEAWLGLAPENDQALFILAAAIHNALHPEEEVIKYSGRKVVRLLVEREISRLRKISEKNGLRNDNFCAYLKAMATICDTIPEKNLKALLENTGLHKAVPADANLQSCLRHTGLVCKGAINALKPDIIAAAFTVVALEQDNDIAPDLLWHALKSDPAGGLNRLARLNHDADIVLGMHENTLGRWLAEAVQEQPDRCVIIEPFLTRAWLPRGLIPASVVVNNTLISVTDDDKEKARLSNNLGSHYSDLGMRKEALEAGQRAVEIYERLAESDPGAFLPDLAMSLNNLGNRYSYLGMRKEALEAGQRAVEIRERLAESDPGAFLPDLAMSLGAIGTSYSTDGQHENAHNAFLRGVQALITSFRRYPEGVGPLMNSLLGDYMKECQALNKKPDKSILSFIKDISGKEDE
jgi:tetratricopeptide (TPR) repeat protein